MPAILPEVHYFLPVHGTVLITGLVLFARIVNHHRLVWLSGWRDVEWRAPPPVVPAVVKLATVAAGLCAGLFFYVLFQSGEGYPRETATGAEWVVGDTVVRTITRADYHAHHGLVFRMFSTWWLFFSLIHAWVSHVVERRIRALRTALERVA
jgi:hypothetical protein